MSIDHQIERVLQKLRQAKQADRKLEVFGAGKHKYHLNAVLSEHDASAFEQDNSVRLPDDYRAFLTKVGNGGAGPFYGIYPLKQSASYFGDNALQLPCQISPSITKDQWENLFQQYEDLPETASEEEEEFAWQSIYGGLLVIASQGCSYLNALVVNGPHAGRVVNLNEDGLPPTFAYEASFLDWYARWLDEVIAGYSLQSGGYWFGYLRGGDDVSLMDQMRRADDQDKLSFLQGLGKLTSVQLTTLEQLEKLSDSSAFEIRRSAILYLTKFAPDRAARHLLRLINGNDAELLAACQAINWYAKDRARDFADAIRSRSIPVEDPETFRFTGYVMNATQDDWTDLLRNYCQHKSEDIRRTAFYFLGEQSVSVRKQHIDVWIHGLQDESASVIHATLQALHGMTEHQLFPAFMSILQRFQADDHYILTNLNLRLKEHGFSSPDQFRRYIEGESTAVSGAVKGWIKRQWK